MSRNPPRLNPPEVVFDLSQRLPHPLLSLAWKHLWESEGDLTLPMPPELSHLTELEWHLCLESLRSNLHQKAHSPLQ